MEKSTDISYAQELLRKSIHLLSLLIPLIYLYISRTEALFALIPMTLLFLTGDVLVHRSGIFRKIVLEHFGKMMRAHELRSDKLFLNGATYVLLSATLCVMIFPKIIAITGFTILIISDICAALVGRKYGKTKFLDKSLEGTIAFIITAIIVIFLLYWLHNLPLSFCLSGIIASIIGGLIENISIRLHLDDNFSIPISIGIILWIISLSEVFPGGDFSNLL